MTLDATASNGIKDNEGKGTSTLGTSLGAGRVLNSIALYGANSSGKSNLFRAIGTMRKMVLGSVKLNDNDPLPYDPFLLSTQEAHPTRFEIVYFEPQTRATFTYGFEYDETTIEKEWLIAKWPRRGEKHLFSREKGEPLDVDSSNFAEGVRARDTLQLNSNRLFLSLAGQAGGEISNSVIGWFRDDLSIISGIQDTYSQYTRSRVLNNPETKEKVQGFLRKMGLGFDTFIPKKVDLESLGLPAGIPKELIAKLERDPYIQVSSIHKVYNEEGEEVRSETFDLDTRESAGTNKLFSLAAPLLETLEGGKILFVDELDSKLHPILSWHIVEMFNSPDQNPNHAQLVFTTHDTNLLSNELFRRDQIWFAEKDKTEKTDIYPLINAHKNSDHLDHAPRNDSNYQKNYIQGKYGAIPFLECGFPSD